MTANEKIPQIFFKQVWNMGDLDSIDEYVAPEYKIHSDPGDPWDDHLTGFFDSHLPQFYSQLSTAAFLVGRLLKILTIQSDNG